MVGITVVATIIAMRFVNREVERVKERVVYERRKRRQARLNGDIPIPTGDTTTQYPMAQAQQV